MLERCFFFTVLIMQSRTVSVAVCFIPRVSGLFIYNGVYELILSLLYAIHKLGLRDELFALSRRMVNDSVLVLLDVLGEELTRKHYPATIVLLIRCLHEGTQSRGGEDGVFVCCETEGQLQILLR